MVEKQGINSLNLAFGNLEKKVRKQGINSALKLGLSHDIYSLQNALTNQDRARSKEDVFDVGEFGALFSAVVYGVPEELQLINDFSNNVYERNLGKTDFMRAVRVLLLHVRNGVYFKDMDRRFVKRRVKDSNKTYPQHFATQMWWTKSSYLSKLENKVLSYYLKGLDYNEIATIMNKSLKSIDNSLQRIKKKISLILDENDNNML